MQPDQRRKRKRFLKLKLKTPFFASSSCSIYYSIRFTFLFLFFLFFIFFNGFPFLSYFSLKPLLTVFRSTSLSVATHFSINISHSSELIKVQDSVLFPDHVLLLISNTTKLSSLKRLDCIFNVSSSSHPVLSVDYYNQLQSIARCPLSPSNNSSILGLKKHGIPSKNFAIGQNQTTHFWENLVYAAVLDGETTVVFVKGLNLRPGRVSDPAQFTCHFNWDNSKGENYAFITHALTAAQEIVRCSLPASLLKHPGRAHGVGVSIAMASHPSHPTIVRGRLRGRVASFHPPIPSVAKIVHSNYVEQGNKKHELCVCTMLWNQAPSLREWITYHTWLGVQRWFIYDNNSDDDIEEVIKELQQENYNVSRHTWPWIKSQEAGFSHCILKAKNECKWVAFMDVDEFFYFPFPTGYQGKMSDLEYVGHNSLLSLVTKFSSSKTIREIRTVCHSFGPSGLTSPPSQGMTAGYTCRLQRPERHKSIVQPDALDDTLLNVVHHFHLKRGYRYLNLAQNIAVINHYKYQVWEVFRSKFYRRVATYVTDWKENQNEGSKDRAPGLGTEAIEPPKWHLQFCEVWDTGLRDLVVANLADPISGLLPWEKPLV